jgi:hypothetical protein
MASRGQERTMGRRLEVYLADGDVRDVKLDGESLWPIWFKVEWKETGARSAKIAGERLSTNHGDEIVLIHEPADEARAPVAPRLSDRR